MSQGPCHSFPQARRFDQMSRIIQENQPRLTLNIETCWNQLEVLMVLVRFWWSAVLSESIRSKDSPFRLHLRFWVTPNLYPYHMISPSSQPRQPHHLRHCNHQKSPVVMITRCGWSITSHFLAELTNRAMNFNHMFLKAGVHPMETSPSQKPARLHRWASQKKSHRSGRWEQPRNRSSPSNFMVKTIGFPAKIFACPNPNEKQPRHRQVTRWRCHLSDPAPSAGSPPGPWAPNKRSPCSQPGCSLTAPRRGGGTHKKYGDFTTIFEVSEYEFLHELTWVLTDSWWSFMIFHDMSSEKKLPKITLCSGMRNLSPKARFVFGMMVLKYEWHVKPYKDSTWHILKNILSGNLLQQMLWKITNFKIL